MQRRRFLSATLATTALGAVRLVPAQGAAAAAQSPTRPFLVKAGTRRFGEPTPFHGINPNDVKVSGRDTGGALAVFEYVGQEPAGPSYHLHLTQDEIFYVVAGEYLFKIDGEEFIARPGDTVFGPRQVPHTWRQLTPHGKLVYQVQPAGTLEQFFQAVSHLPGPPTAAQMHALHLAHGMQVVGPPLSSG